MIDVAERIFIRIAEEIIKRECPTVSEIFASQIFEAEVEGKMFELLSPEGLLEGIKGLGIDDLTD